MKKYQAWLGVALSALFLYLAFRQSDPVEIGRAIRRVDLGVLVLSLPVLFLTLMIRALRWRYLLTTVGRPSLHALFSAIMIGFMSLNLLPFRLGEFIRAYVLGKRENLAKSTVFATIVVERVFDGFTLLFLLLIPLFFLSIPDRPAVAGHLKTMAFLALGLYLTAVTGLVLIWKKTDWFLEIMEWLMRPLPRLQRFALRQARAFAHGLDAVSNPKIFLMVVFYSLLLWAGYVLFYWLIMFAFTSPEGQSLGRQAGWVGAVFVLVVVSMGIMLPSSPGFVGVFELACILALRALGAEKGMSESYALVVHAWQFVPVTLTGIAYLYFHHFSFKEIQAGGHAAVSPEAGGD